MQARTSSPEVAGFGGRQADRAPRPDAPREQPLGVLVADDHPVYREALTQRVRQVFEPALEVASASTFEDARNLVAGSARRWLVLLDLLMPGLKDVEGVRALRMLPNVDHVVALSGVDAETWEPRVLDAGASLFVSKCNTSDFICARLQWLMERDGRAPAPPAETAADYRLTLRQQQVLRLMGEGWPNKIVADRLQITEQTVKLHVKQIFKELRVYNRTQAVLKAQKLQIL